MILCCVFGWNLLALEEHASRKDSVWPYCMLHRRLQTNHMYVSYLLCFELLPLLPQCIHAVDCAADLQAMCQPLLAIDIIYIALRRVTQHL